MVESECFLRDPVKRDVLLLSVSAASLLLSLSGVFGDSPVDPAWVAIVLCGAPILWDAVTGLVLRHDIKADVLVAIALIAAICLQEWFAAGEVALIMAIGGFLEDFSADRASRGIERLMDMTPRTGRIVDGGGVSTVPVDDVRVGQVLRVLPGESVPVDGRISSGSTSIDQSVITGESVPVDKGPGDDVFSGTINQMGAFDMVATRTSEDSSMQRMSKLVSSVDASETRVVRVADRWATYLVIIVMVLAIATYALTGDIYRAVTVMIVFCPCAFILAAPTAIVATICNLTRRGVLVKDGDSLQRMSSVDTVVFDKTGTITEGRPSVVSVDPVGDMEGFLSAVASAESRSEHPMGRAMMAHFRDNGVAYPEPSDFSMVVARGVIADVEGRTVMVGNSTMLGEHGVAIPAPSAEDADTNHQKGFTTVFVSIDGEFAGSITLSDRIRPTSASTVSELGSMGISCVLMTGDNPRSASFMASSAGISDVLSECTPEDKMEKISGMQASGHRLCMVGDGINDAPALRKAWVGLAISGAGNDIAVDAADMALVRGEIGVIPDLVDISRRMMGKINANIVFSLCWNLLAVALSMAAVLGPVTGALVHNVGSVIVVVNSALLMVGGRSRRPDGSPSRRDRV